MPLGTQNNSNNKPFYLRIRTQDKDKKPITPEFEVKTKDADGAETITSTRKAAGNLVAVKVSKRTIQAPTGPMEVDDVKIVLEDASNEEVYFIDARPNQLTRSLYNSLLALKSGENVSISLYQTKPNDQGKVYPAISLWQNNSQVKWAHGKDELPEVEEIKNKKGEVISRDYSELNEYFFEKLKTLTSTFAKQPQKEVAKEATPEPIKKGKSKKKEEAVVAASDPLENLDDAPEDDIPF